MKFAFIEKNRGQYKVTRLCDLLGVSPSGFYAWQSRPESQHRQYDKKLMSLIRELHQGFRRSYGAARLHQELINKDYPCSRRRINRLMRELGIKASTTGLYAWRPGQHMFYSCTGNRLKQEPRPEAPGVQWVGDFTHIKTRSGWLYHAVVLDLFSRKVVGWSFSRKRNAELTKSALRMALSRCTPEAGCIFHSDQGIEYAAHEYRALVESAGMTRSMSRKGNPLDNATAESFFHTLKAELVHHRLFENDIDAVAHIVEYIEFYNRERLHSGIDYQSPEKYEKLCA
ncbi:transposase InsO family protein [Thiogranum longum]|uniref:Transposase InsO family protein n=1 Tax=Thiogranum longum TaxID=1537524 RepID=A0A4R1HE29_9GAMM|nr:IS3 family transposase [Thiogranum longum]TCK18565.1 transposase InsO family protein [Thiogranum longum]